MNINSDNRLENTASDLFYVARPGATRRPLPVSDALRRSSIRFVYSLGTGRLAKTAKLRRRPKV